MILENEKPLDTIQRHLKEIENNLEGWQAELCRSLLQKDRKYQAYCETWISICKNTAEMLEKEKANWMED